MKFLQLFKRSAASCGYDSILVYLYAMKYPLKPLSRGDLAAEQLKRAILAGEYRPGAPLVEREIAARFAISKTPVREALRSLASSRLIVMSGYKAAFVRRLDVDMINEVFELRERLEPWAVCKFLDYLSSDIPEIEAELRTSFEAAGRGDWPAAGFASTQMHRLLYARCGNEVLVELLDKLQDLLCFTSINLWRFKPTWSTEFSEHAEIVNAVKQKNSSAVYELLSTHISAAHKHALDMLKGATDLSDEVASAPSAANREPKSVGVT